MKRASFVLPGCLVVFLSVSLLAGCSPITPPFMQNALSVPIGVAIAYTNGTESSDVWQPHMTVACGREDTEIAELAVEASGHIIHRLFPADVRRMLGSVSDPRAVVWQIRQTDIVPVAKQ